MQMGIILIGYLAFCVIAPVVGMLILEVVK
jgi:hypothetical protein